MDAFTGMIAMFGFNFPPRDWAFCAGQTVAISQYSALFSLIGTFYGGDGRSTVGLPNLVSRAPIGYAMGTPYPPNYLTYQIGTALGAQFHTLSLNEMPTHTHTATFTPTGGGDDAEVLASTSIADKKVAGVGDFIASAHPATGVPRFIGAGSAAPVVELGGVSGGGAGGGTVTVQNNGSSQSFPIQGPVQAINFCIMLDGLYPSRN